MKSDKVDSGLDSRQNHRLWSGSSETFISVFAQLKDFILMKGLTIKGRKRARPQDDVKKAWGLAVVQSTYPKTRLPPAFSEHVRNPLKARIGTHKFVSRQAILRGISLIISRYGLQNILNAELAPISLQQPLHS